MLNYVVYFTLFTSGLSLFAQGYWKKLFSRYYFSAEILELQADIKVWSQQSSF